MSWSHKKYHFYKYTDWGTVVQKIQKYIKDSLERGDIYIFIEQIDKIRA